MAWTGQVGEERPALRSDAAWAAALADPTACRSEVVAMQLIRRPSRTGRTPGQRPEHVCNLVVDGAGELFAPGPTRRLAPGTLFWIPPGQPFGFSADPGTQLCWLNCRFRLHHAGAIPAFSADLIFRTGVGACRRWFELWLEDRRSGHPQAGQRFILGLALLWGDLHRPERRVGGLDRRGLQAFIRQHAARRPSPADLAREAELSPDHFRRVFRRSFGLSPRAWILRERLALAADRLRLERDRGVAELVASLGWDDPALFSRQFRAAYGQPPDRWRRA